MPVGVDDLAADVAGPARVRVTVPVGAARWVWPELEVPVSPVVGMRVELLLVAEDVVVE